MVLQRNIDQHVEIPEALDLENLGDPNITMSGPPVLTIQATIMS